MKITVITNRKLPLVTHSKVNSIEGKQLMTNFLASSKTFAFDYETTGLDPLQHKILLTTISNNKEIFILDNKTVNLLEIIPSLEDKEIIAHSIPFEYKWSLVNNLKLGIVYCTLTAEQKLTVGTSIPCDLVSTCRRRQTILPPGMDKDIRSDFYTIEDLEYIDDHINYAAADVIPLFKIKEEQQKLIKKYRLEFYINILQMRIAKIIPECELLGFVHNKEKWTQIADTSIINQKELEKKLHILCEDIHFKYYLVNSVENKKKQKLEKRLGTLKDRWTNYTKTILQQEKDKKTHLKSYNVLLEKRKKLHYQIINTHTELDNFNTEIRTINWESSKQVLDLLDFVKCPKPVKKVKGNQQYSFAKEAREDWFIKYSNDSTISNKLKDLMSLLHEHCLISHNINSFGKEWINKYTHPVTGKVHTSYRQTGTETGRWSSGNRSEGYFNSQQIPAKPEYRECFGTDPGYDIVTADLVTGELIIMASMAQDQDLLRIGKGDMHSYMANKVWHNIYHTRLIKKRPLTIKDTRGNTYTLPVNISKTENSQLRTDFKSETFGCIYGMHDKRAGETILVDRTEGQTAIDTIKGEIPLTFSMVETKSKEAFFTGKVLHNRRTNSRRWFKPILELKWECKRNNIDFRDYTLDDIKGYLKFLDVVSVDGAARNSCIQGTLSDMITEMIVFMDKFIKIYKIDADFMGTVHDELIYRYHETLDWFPNLLKTVMIRVANKYLDNVEMDVEVKIGKTWIK